MSCKSARTSSTRIPVLGGDDPVLTVTTCAIKQRSKTDQIRVYDQLFTLGLEASMLTDVCPVAATGNWNACPFKT